MNAEFKKIRVMAMSRKIFALTGELDTLSRHKDKASINAAKVAKAQS